MKPRRHAFTLVELLVVVALIAILMSMVMSGLWKSKLKANINRAQVDMKSMEQAIRCYRIEYERWPGLPGGLNETRTWGPASGVENRDLIKYLVSSNPVPPRENLNPRRRVFWETQGTNLSFIDSWGTPFNVTIDITNKTIVITSAGPDKNWATAGDNLTYEGR